MRASRGLKWENKMYKLKRSITQSNIFGRLLAFKQTISSSLKHDTVPRVSKEPPNLIALWDCASSE